MVIGSLIGHAASLGQAVRVTSDEFLEDARNEKQRLESNPGLLNASIRADALAVAKAKAKPADGSQYATRMAATQNWPWRRQRTSAGVHALLRWGVW